MHTNLGKAEPSQMGDYVKQNLHRGQTNKSIGCVSMCVCVRVHPNVRG